MSDRVKNMCWHLVPIYYGDRPVNTRGEPNTSKDYYFICYHSADTINDPGYRQASSISELCNGCKEYHHNKRLTKEEIQKKSIMGKEIKI